jgi:ATP-dependent Clp protease ATP-binding subunit ClpB
MAHRYLTERKLPDKAIDLLDEAASRLRMQQESKPEPIADMERQVLDLQIELASLEKEIGSAAATRRRELQVDLHAKQAKAESANAQWTTERRALEQRKTARQRLEQARKDLAAAERDGNFAKAGELLHAVVPRLERELEQWEGAAAKGGTGAGEAGGGEGGGMLSEQVTSAHIAAVVSKMTGIPTTQLDMSERDKLLQLEAKLAQTVVGQDHALRVIADAVRVSRAGLQNPDRPLGVFLLVGPTGVGKTQLCKALAGQLFDSEEAVTRIDMSEYSERHSVSRLVGAPPGYVDGH